MKKFLAMLLAAMMVLCCAAAFAEEAGFEETPIGEELDIDVLHIAAVYFQPVPMEPEGEFLAVEDSAFHLEADISYNENELGFGVGDWACYLTVDYTITSETTGEVASEGTFMVMSANDGPHYGANIAPIPADTYTLTFTIHSPAENGYLLHTDEETGVPGHFWDAPITASFEGWEYVEQEW